MKMIIAIVQPQQLTDIKEALLTAGFEHMTCTNILGTVANQHEEHKYRGASQEIFLFQKIRLEIGVADEKVGEVIEALSSGAKESGGSGLAFVTELSDCVKLGTGDHGESVL
jgi:nitrogen regulatory protein P-II 1